MVESTRDEDFRKLLLYVVDWLEEEAVDKLGFLSDVPQERRKTGLSVLEELVKRGKISPTHTQCLVDLLEKINKCQVAEYVKENYQARYPDHKAIGRAFSLPTKPSPNLTNGRRRQRSNTEHNIQIIISHPSDENAHMEPHVEDPTPKKCDHEGLLHVPSLSTDCDGRASYPQNNPHPQSNSPKILTYQEDAGRENEKDEARSDRPRSWTDTEELKEGNKEQLKRSASANVVYSIAVYISPPPSPTNAQSIESLQNEKSFSLSPPTKFLPNGTSLQSPSQHNHSSFSPPQSTGGDLEENGVDLQKMDEGEAENGGGLTMKLIPSNVGETQSAVVPSTQTSTPNTTPQAANPSTKDKGKGRPRGGGPWTTQHTWSLRRQQLLQPIWNHEDLHYIKYHQKIPIDIECTPAPHLSLFVYPNGLFEDRNKSMTLMVKITVPEECPPIPSKETFELRWGVSVAARTLENSKKPVKIKFKAGVKYIHKLLPHKVVKDNNCETLELRVHISTGYSVYQTYPTTDICNKTSKSIDT